MASDDARPRKVPFLCECGDIGCERCLPMTVREYTELAEEPPGLALADGHQREPPLKSSSGVAVSYG